MILAVETNFSVIVFSKYQQRFPNELLCGLSECLLDNTVFGIVEHLMDIQHYTEKQLFRKRLRVINDQAGVYYKLIFDILISSNVFSNSFFELQLETVRNQLKNIMQEHIHDWYAHQITSISLLKKKKKEENLTREPEVF